MEKNISRIIVFLMVLSVMLNSVAFASDEFVLDKKISFSGYGHVQSFYDLNGEYDKEHVFTLGTTGKRKRLEGFNLKIDNAPSNMLLVYRAHVQTEGDLPNVNGKTVWEDPNDESLWVKAGEYIGTKGYGKRLEGIQLRLIDKNTNEDYKGYRIEYQVHMAKYGWGVDNEGNAMKLVDDPQANVDVWKSNGDFAGTKEEYRRVECIKIRILKEDTKPTPPVEPGVPVMPPIEPEEPETIRIMNYNIRTGIGIDGVYDLKRTLQVIRESGADIVGLTEVDVNFSDRSNFDNQVAILSKELDMYSFYGHIYDMDPTEEGKPRRKYGMAILSKYPIVDSTNHEITRLSTQGKDPIPTPMPGFPEAKINVNGNMLYFHVTHLDYRGDPIVREMQVDDMLNIYSEIAGPKILVGDLNALPDAPELVPLFEYLNDSWDLTGEGEGYTFPVDNPHKRIDYILTSTKIEVVNAEVIDADASDHSPVIVDIKLQEIGEQDLAKAQSVADLIANLPKTEDITLEHKEDIMAAREEYNNLTDDQRVLIIDYRLEKAEAKIRELEKAADKKVIEDELAKVVDLQLDEVTVEKIQMAVEGLIENEEITVTVEIVNSDEGTYKISLTKGEVTASKDITVTKQGAYQPVIDMIEALPNPAEVEKIDAKLNRSIVDTRKAYDNLSDKDKALVSNIDKLEEFEEMMREVKNWYCVRYTINSAKISALDNVQKLMDKGFENAFALYDPSRDWHWVVADKFGTKEEADAGLAELELAGFGGVVAQKEFAAVEELRPVIVEPKAPEEEFIDIVNSLPAAKDITEIKADEKLKAENARKLYDALSDELKTTIPLDLVNKLEAVEARIQELKTPLQSKNKATILQAQTWAIKRGAHKRFIEISPIYWEFNERMGICSEILYCQAAKETNFGKYTGAVKPEMNNWAGIKVADPTGDKTEDHETFETPWDGVRGHFNHLGIYCGVEPIGEPHPRWYKTSEAEWAGTIRYTEDLGGLWAPNPDYGISIVRDYLKDLYATEALNEADFAVVKDVIDRICALADKREFTLDDKEEVEEARAAFEALDKALKDLLLAPANKYYENTLKAAEAKIRELEKAADKKVIEDALIKVVDLQLDEVTVEKIQMAVEGLIENEEITVTVEIVNSDEGTYKISLTKGEVTASKDITVTVIQETDKEAIQKE
ncbi:MAG: hypothetical protein ACFWUE_08360 [Xylanivirga thermophila]|jgi:endonuclease/exonuclease/phosphatase family metal-dependent hydrolase|uniref:endonuclease/exonuclease/phosphatase family protein n=1 Tax=Xylanivirga thermophila TaxID=2496273 RepID=UPI0039F5740F